jgi:hypothetical protein
MPDLNDERSPVAIYNVPGKGPTQLRSPKCVGDTARVYLRADIGHATSVASREYPHDCTYRWSCPTLRRGMDSAAPQWRRISKGAPRITISGRSTVSSERQEVNVMPWKPRRLIALSRGPVFVLSRPVVWSAVGLQRCVGQRRLTSSAAMTAQLTGTIRYNQLVHIAYPTL